VDSRSPRDAKTRVFTTEERDELDSFCPLLSYLRLEKLPQLAISLKSALLGADASSPLTCTVSLQPLTGAYNILYRVSFSDGVAWVFKVHALGTCRNGQKWAKECSDRRQIR